MEFSPVTDNLVWSFGDCSLDERRLELSVAGETVDVEARPLELLLHLLRHAGELVTKDELLEAVWPGRIPSESVLTKTVAKLRQALRDESQTLIRTIYGQGYRLIAPVAIATAPVSLPGPGFASDLAAGASPPLRPHWALQEGLSGGGHNEVWLARHDKTGQSRVFKFARDAAGLRALKREITLFRVLSQTPGIGDHLLEILDWNLDEPPYFTEYPFVPGGSLSQWIERNDVQTEGGGLALRLELLAQTAETLAAAHDAGVLHKDVKPGNVLVDTDPAGRPLVRLADFGSGQVVDLERLARLEITRLGFTQTVAELDSSGTPLYLAPELLGGQAPSVRSDVYALGVMLYQLVVGDFRRPLAPGWEREVADPLLCEDIAACADLDPARRLVDARLLAQRLRSLAVRRDARAKAITEREETERLRRRLERVRTRRPWLAASAALLVLGLASATLLWLRAERAGERAEQEAALAAAVNSFLTDDLLAAADPLQSGRSDVPVSELLATASQRAASRFAGRPEVEAALREAIGRAYGGLSDYDAAEQELGKAIALLDGQPAQKARLDALRLSLIELDLSAERTGKAGEQIAMLEAQAPEDATAALRLRSAKAWLAFRSGDQHAITELEALRPDYDALMAEQPARYLQFAERLAEAYRTAGRIEPSIALFRELLQRQSMLYSERDVRSILAMVGLAQGLWLADRTDEALPLLLDADRLARETLGSEHDISLTVAAELAGLYTVLQKYGDAEALYKKTLEIRLRRNGEDHLNTRIIAANLAALYARMGRHEEALVRLRELYAGELRIGGEAAPRTLNIAHNIGTSLAALERWPEALEWQSRTLELSRKTLAADDWNLGQRQAKLAETRVHLGRTQEARKDFDEAIALLRRTLGDEHSRTRKAIELRESLLPAAGNE